MTAIRVSMGNKLIEPDMVIMVDEKNCLMDREINKTCRRDRS